MSETENQGKAGAWTEEAKVSIWLHSVFNRCLSPRLRLLQQCQFLLHIIAQLKGDNNKAICWGKINMPGRTTKSLQNMWTKINKTIAEMEAAAANGEEAPKTIRELFPLSSSIGSRRDGTYLTSPHPSSQAWPSAEQGHEGRAQQ